MTTRINDDFSKPVIVRASQLDWTPSPAPGVERRMLYRVGGEVARATSIVRYAPESHFPRHVHTGGEEILVLDGVFQDEHGDYPAGSYFRNPPGTAHVPASLPGCIIFVRLWQFRRDDHAHVAQGKSGGLSVPTRPGAGAARVLFDDGHEQVRIEDWAAGETVRVANSRGLEFLVVSGGIRIDGQDLDPQGWGRLPPGAPLQARVGSGGARIWLKDAPALHPDVLELPA